MAIREVLLLGNPKLYESCAPVVEGEIESLRPIVRDLHDTLMDFRRRRGAGRAIAAPQIGVMKRLVYMHIDQPVVLLNPVLDLKSQEMMEVWDDCMCFPDLLVKVERHRGCRMTYRDMDWREQTMMLERATFSSPRHHIASCSHRPTYQAPHYRRSHCFFASLPCALDWLVLY
jgi:peptide deformylase